MENSRFIRAAALWCAIGSLISLAGCVIELTAHDFVTTPGMAIPRHLVLLAMNVLMLAGIVGLTRSGAVGGSLVGRIALGAALLGQSVFVVAELAGILGANNASQEMIYAIGSVLVILGMSAVGVVVLLGKRWHSWHAWTPLLWGLYLLGVLPVATALRGSAASLALGLLGLPTLLLSIALWQEAGERKVVQPGLAG
jgi:hypothetical protein